MYCTNCGAKIRIGGTFCGRCGYQVTANEIPQQSDLHEMEIIGTQEMVRMEGDSEEIKTRSSKNIEPHNEPTDISSMDIDTVKEEVTSIPKSENMRTDPTAEPLSAFPEICDGVPDPTNSGIMNVAANATETDKITTVSPPTDRVDYKNTDSPSFNGEERQATTSNPAYSYVSNGGVPITSVGILNSKMSNDDEKTFFGKGAFTLCLVVIGLLSIACGVLAGLHFNLV